LRVVLCAHARSTRVSAGSCSGTAIGPPAAHRL
jgi:hypothetical protein